MIFFVYNTPISNEDMILALAGQFKQLSHEPEKFRWLNGIRTHEWVTQRWLRWFNGIRTHEWVRIPLSHLNFSGSWDNCLNCPASARIISSFDFKHRTAYNISFIIHLFGIQRLSVTTKSKIACEDGPQYLFILYVCIAGSADQEQELFIWGGMMRQGLGFTPIMPV